MTHATLAIPEAMWAELQEWATDADEVAGVLTARLIDDAGGTTLIARRLHRAEPDTYIERRPDGLSLRSTAWVPAVRAASADGSMALFVHTHPRGYPAFSRWDDVVDNELRRPFIELTGSALYGSLVVAGPPGGFAGRIHRADGAVSEIDTVRVVGDRIAIHLQHGSTELSQIHDRQIRALGQAGQAALSALRVGVVGVGGTGSPAIEQLARLGVGHLTVIDDDVVTPSTVSRGYGSTTADIGSPKVDVVARHVRSLGLDTKIHPVQANIRSRRAIDALRHCDAVLCCVDGHGARLILNRWAYWHLAPVIDVGVLVTSSGSTIESIIGRVTWLSPGSACLLCRGRIDPRLAHVEQLEPEERRRLAEQGYAPDLGEPDPSIVTYTSLVASFATTELLNRLFDLAPAEATELLIQIHLHTISSNRRRSRDGCFCGDATAWAQAQSEPYLDLTWSD